MHSRPCSLHPSPTPPSHDPAQTISRRLRDLVDLELQRSFVERWRLAGVAVPPASATAYASPRLPQRFALCHELAPRDSLAGLAVRYRSDVVALRRFNSLLSDHSLSSRWVAGGRDHISRAFDFAGCTPSHILTLPSMQDPPVCASTCPRRGGVSARSARDGGQTRSICARPSHPAPLCAAPWRGQAAAEPSVRRRRWERQLQQQQGCHLTRRRHLDVGTQHIPTGQLPAAAAAACLRCG